MQSCAAQKLSKNCLNLCSGFCSFPQDLKTITLSLHHLKGDRFNLNNYKFIWELCAGRFLTSWCFTKTWNFTPHLHPCTLITNYTTTTLRKTFACVDFQRMLDSIQHNELNINIFNRFMDTVQYPLN